MINYCVTNDDFACAKQLEAIKMRNVLIFFVLHTHNVITDGAMPDYSMSIDPAIYLGIRNYGRVIPQYKTRCDRGRFIAMMRNCCLH